MIKMQYFKPSQNQTSQTPVLGFHSNGSHSNGSQRYVIGVDFSSFEQAYNCLQLDKYHYIQSSSTIVRGILSHGCFEKNIKMGHGEIVYGRNDGSTITIVIP